MCKTKRRDLSADEQRVLESGHLQLLTSPEDIARCDQAIVQHHYLHNVTLVGEHLRYAFIYQGQWLAVATWSSAAFHLKDRDTFVGWTPNHAAAVWVCSPITPVCWCCPTALRPTSSAAS